MPVACSSSALVGADGFVEFAPGGTSVCLAAADFSNAQNHITVGANARFRVGDPVTFTVEGGATLDTGITASSHYFVNGIPNLGEITVAASAGGTTLTLNGDGVDGGGHVNIAYDGTNAVCSVQEWSLDLSKDTIDVTTLPCSLGTSGNQVAPVRKTQGSFLNGEGSMTLLFTADQQSMGNRLLADSVMADSTVYAKLYISAVAGAGAVVNDSGSMYYAGKVNLLGFSITANTSDALTAEVSFSIADTPDAIFGVTV